MQGVHTYPAPYKGKGREGKGKGREGKGREGKGREGKGREGEGQEGPPQENMQMYNKQEQGMPRQSNPLQYQYARNFQQMLGSFNAHPPSLGFTPRSHSLAREVLAMWSKGEAYSAFRVGHANISILTQLVFLSPPPPKHCTFAKLTLTVSPPPPPHTTHTTQFCSSMSLNVQMSHGFICYVTVLAGECFCQLHTTIGNPVAIHCAFGWTRCLCMMEGGVVLPQWVLEKGSQQCKSWHPNSVGAQMVQMLMGIQAPMQGQKRQCRASNANNFGTKMPAWAAHKFVDPKPVLSLGRQRQMLRVG